MPERRPAPCGADTRPSPGATTYRYRDDVLAALERHGVRPRPSTPPALVAGYVNDLYRYELRRVRDGARRKDFPPDELSERVVELRRRYPLVSLPARFWAEAGPDDTPSDLAPGAAPGGAPPTTPSARARTR